MYIQVNGSVINDGSVLLNGQGLGDTGMTLNEVRFEPGALRPYIDERGRRCADLRTGEVIFNNKTRTYHPVRRKFLIDDLERRGIRSPVFNATSLTKDAWMQLDTAVVRATRKRLKAYTDLQSRSSVPAFDAMGKSIYEYQAMTDPGEAVKDMDALSDARRDRPSVVIRATPLPITHSDFSFSARDIAISRNSRVPLDTAMAEAAGRRVAEMVEKTLIGVETGMTFGTETTGPFAHQGTSTEYGYTNFPYRVTKTDLHSLSASSPEQLIEDLIEMREQMYANGFYGPFVVYYSTGYDRYLDDDYFRTGGTSAVRSLRERAMEIEGITSMSRLDYLTSGFQIIMVQVDPEVVQAINGMEITTVQWQSKGGLAENFKVMCIKTQLFRAPYDTVSGVMHGTTS